MCIRNLSAASLLQLLPVGDALASGCMRARGQLGESFSEKSRLLLEGREAPSLSDEGCAVQPGL